MSGFWEHDVKWKRVSNTTKLEKVSCRFMSQNIEGKVVVITGASSGLGEATARLLSAQGASVVLGARRVDGSQALADELNRSGGKALAIPTDVTHADQVKRLID